MNHTNAVAIHAYYQNIQCNRFSKKNLAWLRLIIINFLLIVVSASFSSKAFANDWRITITPCFGFYSGTIYEYLFGQSVAGTYEKVSELDWEIKPILYYGGKISVAWRGLALLGYGRGFIPMRCGAMYDSDWTNVREYGDTKTKTNYSINENSLKNAYAVGGAFSYTCRKTDSFAINVFCGLDFNHIMLNAQNGYGWYADANTLGAHIGLPYTDEKAVVYNKGDLSPIDYMREEVITWLGSAMDMRFVKNRLSLSLAFAISPYLYFQSLDSHHKMRKATKEIISTTYYADVVHGFFAACKTEAIVSYDVTKNFLFSFNIRWTLSQILQGTTYWAVSESGPWRQSNDRSGAGFNYVDISLGGTYRFAF